MGTAALVAGWTKRFGAFPRMASGGASPASVTFPSSVLATRVYIALGADLTESYLSWNWLDITDRCRHDLGITITTGRPDEFSQVIPSRCTIKLDNNDSYLIRHNPFSPYYGLLTPNTPIWIQVDPGSGFSDRFFGYVNEWPPRWADASATDTFVTIQCSGVLRRLAQRTKPLSSTLRRTVLSYPVFGYWPMDDGDNVDHFRSAVGGPTWPVVNVTGSDSTLDGSSSSLPVIEQNGDATFVPVPAYTDTGRWSVFACVLPFAVGVGTGPLVIGKAADGYTYQAVLDSTTFALYIFDAALNLLASPSVAVSGIADTWWTVQVTSSTSDTVTATLYDTFGTLYASISQSNPGTHGKLAGIRVVGSTDPAAAFGHVVATTDTSVDLTEFAVAYSQAAGGFAGEMAHERLRRLCAEENVPFFCTSAVSAAMGPQQSGSLLGLLRECETADLGLLYEYQFGLAYQTVDDRYNAPVTLELDFDSRHVAGTPEPTDDDQRLTNLFTATRTGGSVPFTAEVATGALGTGAGGSGVYDDSATPNVQSDTQLPDYASWRVHLGTVDEPRWPLIGMLMHGTPDLIPGWLSTPLGSRFTAVNVPPPMDALTIDAVIEGYTERWDEVSWAVALNTSPASPYTVFVMEDADLGLLDSGTSTLAAAASSGATSLSVATSSALDLWTTTEVPFDVKVSGITVTVSAVSGASSPQTFTVTGVTKDLPSGAAVELATAVVLGL